MNYKKTKLRPRLSRINDVNSQINGINTNLENIGNSCTQTVNYLDGIKTRFTKLEEEKNQITEEFNTLQTSLNNIKEKIGKESYKNAQNELSKVGEAIKALEKSIATKNVEQGEKDRDQARIALNSAKGLIQPLEDVASKIQPKEGFLKRGAKAVANALFGGGQKQGKDDGDELSKLGIQKDSVGERLKKCKMEMESIKKKLGKTQSMRYEAIKSNLEKANSKIDNGQQNIDGRRVAEAANCLAEAESILSETEKLIQELKLWLREGKIDTQNKPREKHKGDESSDPPYVPVKK